MKKGECFKILKKNAIIYVYEETVALQSSLQMSEIFSFAIQCKMNASDTSAFRTILFSFFCCCSPFQRKIEEKFNEIITQRAKGAL